MGRPKGSKNKVKASKDIASVASLKRKPTHTYSEPDETTGLVEAVPIPKRTRKPKETTPLTKEELKAQSIAPISPAEVAQLRKEARANTPKEGHAESVVARAIDEVIKPNWATTQQDAAGLKHFLVNCSRHGESVSMDKEKWDFALKAAGLRGVLTASKPEAGQDLEANSVNRWRVMIG